MGLFIKLAIRNVKRNIKSTILNGIGISFSVIILLLILSLSRGISTQIIMRNIQFETGALSIVFDKKVASLENKTKGDSLLKKIVSILAKNKEIDSYSFRIYPPNSLLYFGDSSPNINIIGLPLNNKTPSIEKMLKIVDRNSGLINNKKGIIISNAISDNCGIKVGDNCSIMLQSVDGTINMNDFVVTGIFRYTSQLNKYNVYMNYEEAKTLYNSNLPSKILINIRELDDVDKIKKGILNQLNCKTIIKEGEIEFQGMKISSFKDHMGMAKSLSGFNKYGMLGIAFFLVLISFIGIWSMQVENINKRRKEIGSLLSFGFSRSSIKKIFIYESLYISIIFFIAGFFIVCVLILIINSQDGIYLGDSASFAFGSAIVNPVLTLKDVLTTFIIVIIYPFVATTISSSIINKSKVIKLLNGD